MSETEEELKSLLVKLKEESEKDGLKLNIKKKKKTKMASGPIISWQIDGETVKNFIFLVSKSTVDSDCGHELKRHLLLGRKAMTKPRQHIKKQRHYFAKKGLSSKSCGFSSSHVWMWEVDYKRKLSAEELMLLNCGVGEDS